MDLNLALVVETAPTSCTIRWLDGNDTTSADYAVINNHVYQAGFRAPISVARVPEVLETPITIGDEVFYSLDTDAVVIDRAAHGSPMHPERLRADLLPAIVEISTDLRTQEA